MSMHTPEFEAFCDEQGFDYTSAFPEDQAEVRAAWITWERFAPTQGADARHDRLRKFLDMAAGEGYVFDGVDAADLYLEFFPEGPNGGSRG